MNQHKESIEIMAMFKAKWLGDEKSHKDFEAVCNNIYHYGRLDEFELSERLSKEVKEQHEKEIVK
jgi:hypothetical protein